MTSTLHIVVAMKPLDGNFANNAIKHGVAGLNIDACRIFTADVVSNHSRSSDSAVSKGKYGDSTAQDTHQTEGQKLGRFPANVILQDSEKIVKAFPIANSTRASGNPNNPWHGTKHKATSYGQGDGTESHDYRDSGSAARFFKQVKES